MAKVTRDRKVKYWNFREKRNNNKTEIDGREIGSGYPGDQKTIDWLDKYYSETSGFPEIVRFSWKTAKNHLNKRDINMDGYSMYRLMTQKEFFDTGFKGNQLLSSDFIKGIYLFIF